MDANEIQIEIKKVETSTKKENVLNTIKVIIQAVPYVGGSLGSLLDIYIPDFKQKRLHKLIQIMSGEIEHIKNNIKKNYITTEEFAYYFEKSFKASIEEYNEKKIQFYIGFIVGNLNDLHKRTNDEKEFYLKIIATLTPLQLKIMQFMNNPEKYFDYLKIDKQGINDEMYGTSSSKMFELAFPQVDNNIIEKSYEELFRLGLTNNNSFKGLSTINGFASISGRLSQLGLGFINFCTNTVK